MNVIVLYTIWEKIKDLVENPEYRRVIDETDAEPKFTQESGLAYVQEEIEGNDEETSKIVLSHPQLIPDPNNTTGFRYVPIKTVHDLSVARAVTEGYDGRYVYTISEGWFGIPS